MTNIVQETLSINEDDLRRTSSTPLYPVGIIYTTMDDPAPEPSISRPLSKYIYLKADFDSDSFLPLAVQGTGVSGSEGIAINPEAITKPGFNICVPQEIVRDGGAIVNVILTDQYAFFLLSGRGKAEINDAGNAGDYYTVKVGIPAGFEKQASPTQYGTQSHMSLVKNSVPGTPAVEVDIVLFDKLGEVIA